MRTPPRRSRTLHEALNRLEAAEDQVLGAEFLAPLVRGGIVRVRIAGVVCRFAVRPADFQGWGVFRPASASVAELVRPARLAERREYLEGLPRVRGILCRKNGSEWLAIPAHGNDARLGRGPFVPVRLVEEGGLFEVLLARFDGVQCWFEALDSRTDPAQAAYLRDALGRMVIPERLDRPGLTPEQRTAYTHHYQVRLETEQRVRRDRVEHRLRAALEHGGATLRDYQEQGGLYRVAYDVDGRRHVSLVTVRDLTVQVAGLCLSGQDRRFDLQSMAGLLREAYESGG